MSNLDKVTFAFRDSQSDGKLDESKYGDLSVFEDNLDLLQEELTEGLIPHKTDIQTPRDEQTEE